APNTRLRRNPGHLEGRPGNNFAGIIAVLTLLAVPRPQRQRQRRKLARTLLLAVPRQRRQGQRRELVGPWASIRVRYSLKRLRPDMPMSLREERGCTRVWISIEPTSNPTAMLAFVGSRRVVDTIASATSG